MILNHLISFQRNIFKVATLKMRETKKKQRDATFLHFTLIGKITARVYCEHLQLCNVLLTVTIKKCYTKRQTLLINQKEILKTIKQAIGIQEEAKKKKKRRVQEKLNKQI